MVIDVLQLFTQNENLDKTYMIRKGGVMSKVLIFSDKAFPGYVESSISKPDLSRCMPFLLSFF